MPVLLLILELPSRLRYLEGRVKYLEREVALLKLKTFPKD